jgi:hypothetical protein
MSKRIAIFLFRLLSRIPLVAEGLGNEETSNKQIEKNQGGFHSLLGEIRS